MLDRSIPHCLSGRRQFFPIRHHCFTLLLCDSFKVHELASFLFFFLTSFHSKWIPSWCLRLSHAYCCSLLKFFARYILRQCLDFLSLDIVSTPRVVLCLWDLRALSDVICTFPKSSTPYQRDSTYTIVVLTLEGRHTIFQTINSSLFCRHQTLLLSFSRLSHAIPVILHCGLGTST